MGKGARLKKVSVFGAVAYQQTVNSLANTVRVYRPNINLDWHGLSCPPGQHNLNVQTHAAWSARFLHMQMETINWAGLQLPSIASSAPLLLLLCVS